MSYASRLIADSAASAPPRSVAAPVTPLEIEVFEEAPRLTSLGPPPDGTAAVEPIGRPTFDRGAVHVLGSREPDAPRPFEIVGSRADVLPVAPDAPTPAGDAPPSRSRLVGLDGAEPPTAAVLGDARAPIVDGATTPAQPAAESTAGLPADRLAYPTPPETDPPNEGIPWRRLSGTDLVVPAAIPAALPPAPRAVEAPPDPIRDRRPRPGRSDVSPLELDVQHLSLSIGSIEVIVDGPVPAPAATPAPPPAIRPPLDDPIMRLRRQYVTWPEGG